MRTCNTLINKQLQNYKQMSKFPPYLAIAMIFLITPAGLQAQDSSGRARAAEIGVDVGLMTPGTMNMITDVPGVMVGHATRIEGDHIRTGVTAILPHEGNLFREKVPGAIYCFNSFGKMAGSLQVEELGNIESPIVLTNTLNVGTGVEATVAWMLQQPGNENVRSVNALVGETNDGYLNDIRGQHVTREDVFAAIENAAEGRVTEGNVGAGTGTTSLGWKAGIGTASRITAPVGDETYTVGVLVQANFGRMLYINGVPFTREYQEARIGQEEDGSAMIVIATDAPLSERNLERMAKRSFVGMGRTTNFMSNSSGDFAIAFSTAYRIPYVTGGEPVETPDLIGNNDMNTFFQAVEEATQEAIYNALFMAEDMTGNQGNEAKAIPLDKVTELMEEYNMLNLNERLKWRP